MKNGMRLMLVVSALVMGGLEAAVWGGLRQTHNHLGRGVRGMGIIRKPVRQDTSYLAKLAKKPGGQSNALTNESQALDNSATESMRQDTAGFLQREAIQDAVKQGFRNRSQAFREQMARDVEQSAEPMINSVTLKNSAKDSAVVLYKEAVKDLVNPGVINTLNNTKNALAVAGLGFAGVGTGVAATEAAQAYQRKYEKIDTTDKYMQEFTNLLRRYRSHKEDPSDIVKDLKQSADANFNDMEALAKKIELGIGTQHDVASFHRIKKIMTNHYYQLLKELDNNFSMYGPMANDTWCADFHDRFFGFRLGNSLTKYGAQRFDKLVEDVSQTVISAREKLKKAQEEKNLPAKELENLAYQVAQEEKQAVQLLNILSADLDEVYDELEVAKQKYEESAVLTELEKKIVDQKEKILKLSTNVYGETARENKENSDYRKELQYEKKSLVSPWPTTKISNLIYDYSPVPVLSFMNTLNSIPSYISQKLHDIFYAHTDLGRSVLQEQAAGRALKQQMWDDQVDLPDKIGLKVNVIGNPQRPWTDEQRSMFSQMMTEIQGMEYAGEESEERAKIRFRNLDSSERKKYNEHQAEIRRATKERLAEEQKKNSVPVPEKSKSGV